jgi:hypothetical protein
VTAERRAKTHFGREHPFAIRRLARNWCFGLNNRQRLGQPKKIEREQLPKIRLGKDRLLGGRDGGCERSAARMFVAAILVRIVRVMIGICGCGNSVVLMLGCTVCLVFSVTE